MNKLFLKDKIKVNTECRLSRAEIRTSTSCFGHDA